MDVGSRGSETITCAVPRSHGLTLQVVGHGHGAACPLHHALGTGGCCRIHEVGKHAAVIIDEMDMGPSEAGRIGVHVPRVGLWVGGDQLAVRLTLVDQTHRVLVLQVRAQAVRDSCEHGACGWVDLPSGGQDLDVAVRKVRVPGLAILQVRSIVAGIGGLANGLVVEAHWLHMRQMGAHVRRELHVGHVGQQSHGLGAVAHAGRAVSSAHGLAEVAPLAAAEVQGLFRLAAAVLGLVERLHVLA
mmetsp:Transcript_48805/g.91434  ORF Transcript_48805/g.91434 Transcript_48805/m.91434 type:complete len:244 (+) Transcript_48805:873-1604(+)